jgi:ABC-2 type transport system ATP-binding protein
MALAVSGGGLVPAVHAAPTIPAGTQYFRGAIGSFDGTPIVYNLYLPADASGSHQVPLVLRGHGWGGYGETPSSASSTLVDLLQNDYAVLTWDSRGFGQSGDVAHVDSPDFERLDASALIDFAQNYELTPDDATTKPILSDSRGAIVGMTGGSYAGGIQLVTAAFDHRVRAIAPEITWNDLRYSLFPNNVVKLGWTQLLFAAGLVPLSSQNSNQGSATGGVLCAVPGGPSGCTAGIQTGTYAPDIYESEARGLALGAPDATTDAFFAHNSLASGYDAGASVSVPTLLMQGANDTLFNLVDAERNLQAIQAAGGTVKLIAFCGGHVACPYAGAGSDPSRPDQHLDAAIINWFQRYLRNDTTASTGSPVEYELQDGTFNNEPSVPDCSVPGTNCLTGSGSGTIVNPGIPTAGPSGSIDPVVTDSPSQPGDPGTLDIPIAGPVAATTNVFGIPHLTADVSGVGAGAHLFFKLVDTDWTGAQQVLNLQAESYRIDGPLTGNTVHIDIPLPGISFQLAGPQYGWVGDSLSLQIATESAAHEAYRGASVLNVTATVSVPLA